MANLPALPDPPSTPIVLTPGEMERIEALCGEAPIWAAWLAAPSAATLIEIPHGDQPSTYVWFDGRPLEASDFGIIRPLLWVCMRVGRRFENGEVRQELWWNRRPEAPNALRALQRAHDLAQRPGSARPSARQRS